VSDEVTPAATGADPPPPKLGRRLHSALQQLWSSIDAIRHLDEHLAPRAAELDEDRLSPAALTAIGSLSTERQEALRAWWEKHAADDEAPSESPSTAPNPAEPTRADVESTGEPKPEPAEPDGSDDELAQILDNRVVVTEFVNHLVRTLGAPRRESLLRRSLLVTAFGAFEVLVGALVREFYLEHPGAIGDEPKFTLKDLQDLETLDDARDHAVSVKVDSLLQEDLARWEKWFANHPKLTMANLCIDRAALDEMFQRRHIVVHNNGLVSRLYLRRLAGRPDLPALDTPSKSRAHI
jgi:hypothetical protein